MYASITFVSSRVSLYIYICPTRYSATLMQAIFAHNYKHVHVISLSISRALSQYIYIYICPTSACRRYTRYSATLMQAIFAHDCKHVHVCFRRNHLSIVSLS